MGEIVALSARRPPCPFSVGDLITPRANSTYTNAGEPHIVAEIDEVPSCQWVGPPGAPSFGTRPDVRGIVIDGDGDVMTYWVESWQFEPRTGEGA